MKLSRKCAEPISTQAAADIADKFKSLRKTADLSLAAKAAKTIVPMAIAIARFIRPLAIGVPKRTIGPGSENCSGSAPPPKTRPNMIATNRPEIATKLAARKRF
ncbi:unannotated protein [freshwater metagenome]|uniref:Unannotated protein n=1 Tax=freshwater metagenome TaxID=449393 RepID=A0A6J6D507_9ZZZZ